MKIALNKCYFCELYYFVPMYDFYYFRFICTTYDSTLECQRLIHL